MNHLGEISPNYNLRALGDKHELIRFRDLRSRSPPGQIWPKHPLMCIEHQVLIELNDVDPPCPILLTFLAMKLSLIHI